MNPRYYFEYRNFCVLVQRYLPWRVCTRAPVSCILQARAESAKRKLVKDSCNSAFFIALYWLGQAEKWNRYNRMCTRTRIQTYPIYLYVIAVKSCVPQNDISLGSASWVEERNGGRIHRIEMCIYLREAGRVHHASFDPTYAVSTTLQVMHFGKGHWLTQANWKKYLIKPFPQII